jgi:hypothetical protein
MSPREGHWGAFFGDRPGIRLKGACHVLRPGNSDAENNWLPETACEGFWAVAGRLHTPAGAPAKRDMGRAMRLGNAPFATACPNDVCSVASMALETPEHITPAISEF